MLLAVSCWLQQKQLCRQKSQPLHLEQCRQKLLKQCLPCLALQIAHPTFLDWTLPAIEGKQVRMAHVRPAYENVSLHGDVFSQVSLAFAQSCLPTGGALSAHWQMPFCCALALCAVRTREKHL